ncbi:hypothetical protein cce_4822 [Crocosphaera subtropica ATCC 51142]|uniref:Uncharacterized protein n=2 Tax=Crocosphaera TaxID=263510 RepID=B1X209_CROS5|nr:hypothetical protein cce_4822 [Crocosphaera subtropica ATCC 51142]
MRRKMLPNNIQDWQQTFIETNFIVLGFNAWNGYLKSGRGVIVCSTNSPSINRFGESFKTHFVPRSRLAPFLNAWLAAPDTVIVKGHFMTDHILEAVDNYDPNRAVILLLELGENCSFFYLKELPLSPPKCHQTIFKTWDEFKLSQGKLKPTCDTKNH